MVYHWVCSVIKRLFGGIAVYFAKLFLTFVLPAVNASLQLIKRLYAFKWNVKRPILIT